MFKGVNTTGCLPRLDEVRHCAVFPLNKIIIPPQRPSWLPVDIAGRAIAEIVTQKHTPKSAVYHVLNHNTSSSWDVVIRGLKRAGVRFDLVAREEWLDRLAKSDPDGTRNPTIKLLVSDLWI